MMDRKHPRRLIPWLRQNDRWLVVGVALLGVALLFPNLGETYLWTDEADTAAIGRNTLKFGYPLMHDGRNLIMYYPPVFNKDHVEIVLPWLQYYLTAASFGLFGVDTFSARLPFAMLGLASLILFPFVVRRLTEDRWTQLTAPLLLTVTVPFLLYFRQCRYYALIIFATLWLIWAYQALADGRRHAAIHLTCAAIVLFHSHYVVCFGTLAGLGIHWLLTYRQRIPWRTILSMGALFTLFTLPWILYAQFWTHSYNAWFGIRKTLVYTGKLVARLSDDFAPPLLVIVLAWMWSFRSGNRIFRNLWIAGGLCATGTLLNIPGMVYGVSVCIGLAFAIRGAGYVRGQNALSSESLVWMMPCGVILSLAVLSPFDEVRYLVGLAPFVCIGLMYVFGRLRAQYPRLIPVLLVLFVGTNVFRAAPALALSFVPVSAWDAGVALAESDWATRLGIPRLLPEERDWFHRMAVIDESVARHARVQSYLYEYLHELAHAYDGPIEGLTQYLTRYGTPEDTVKIDYDAVSLIFYTDMRILPEHTFKDTSIAADWIILRHSNYQRVPDAFMERIQQRYERIMLPYPDIPWENRPEISLHHFRLPRNWPSVSVYRRRPVASSG